MLAPTMAVIAKRLWELEARRNSCLQNSLSPRLELLLERVQHLVKSIEDPEFLTSQTCLATKVGLGPARKLPKPNKKSAGNTHVV